MTGVIDDCKKDVVGVLSSSMHPKKVGEERRKKPWKQPWAVTEPLTPISWALGENIAITGGASWEMVSIRNSQDLARVNSLYDSLRVDASMRKQ